MAICLAAVKGCQSSPGEVGAQAAAVMVDATSAIAPDLENGRDDGCCPKKAVSVIGPGADT